jgi:hypothetical protein
MFRLIETMVSTMVVTALVLFIAVTIVILVDIAAKKYPACERRTQWTSLTN